MCKIDRIERGALPGSPIDVEYERDVALRATRVMLTNRDRAGNVGESVVLLCFDDGAIELKGAVIKMVDRDEEYKYVSYDLTGEANGGLSKEVEELQRMNRSQFETIVDQQKEIKKLREDKGRVEFTYEVLKKRVTELEKAAKAFYERLCTSIRETCALNEES